MSGNQRTTSSLSDGLYEQLITLRLAQQLEELAGAGWHPVSDTVGPESVPHVLARHVAGTVQRVLQNVPAGERVYAANHILESISTLDGAREWVDSSPRGPASCSPSRGRRHRASMPSGPVSRSPRRRSSPTRRGPEPRLRAARRACHG